MRPSSPLLSPNIVTDLPQLYNHTLPLTEGYNFGVEDLNWTSTSNLYGKKRHFPLLMPPMLPSIASFVISFYACVSSPSLLPTKPPQREETLHG